MIWIGPAEPRSLRQQRRGPYMSPRMTLRSPSCRIAVLGQRATAFAARARITSRPLRPAASHRSRRDRVGAARHAVSSRVDRSGRPSLLSRERGAVQELAATVRVAHKPGRCDGCLQRGRPITSFGECGVPREARVGTSRRASQSLETWDTVRTKPGLAQPAFVVGFPVTLRRPEAFKALHPAPGMPGVPAARRP